MFLNGKQRQVVEVVKKYFVCVIRRASLDILLGRDFAKKTGSYYFYFQCADDKDFMKKTRLLKKELSSRWAIREYCDSDLYSNPKYPWGLSFHITIGEYDENC